MLRHQCSLLWFPGRVLAHPAEGLAWLCASATTEPVPPTYTTGGQGPCGAGGGLAWPRVLLPGERRTCPRKHYSFAGDPGQNPGRAVEPTPASDPGPAPSPPQRTCSPGSRRLYSEAVEISKQKRKHHPSGETAVTELDTYCG